MRITHIPTGIIVQCQNERSQFKNKQMSLRFLKAKLYEKELMKKAQAVESAYDLKKEIAWGSQIRSYVLHPYSMVKDHRTAYETSNSQAVLDGKLDDFIEAYLKARRVRVGREEGLGPYMINFILKKIIGTQNERELKISSISSR